MGTGVRRENQNENLWFYTWCPLQQRPAGNSYDDCYYHCARCVDCLLHDLYGLWWIFLWFTEYDGLCWLTAVLGCGCVATVVMVQSARYWSPL